MILAYAIAIAMQYAYIFMNATKKTAMTATKWYILEYGYGYECPNKKVTHVVKCVNAQYVVKRIAQPNHRE